jgi:hypothetical protein
VNYLQLKDDSTFAPEEACLAEYFGEGELRTVPREGNPATAH